MRAAEVAQDTYVLCGSSGFTVLIRYSKCNRVVSMINIVYIWILSHYFGAVAEVPYILYNPGCFAFQVDIFFLEDIIQIAT